MVVVVASQFIRYQPTMAIVYNRKWFCLSETETGSLSTHRFTHILRGVQHPEWMLVLDDYKPDPKATYEEELQDRRDEGKGEVRMFMHYSLGEILFSRDAGATYAPVILCVKNRGGMVYETTPTAFEFLLPGEVDPLPQEDPARPRPMSLAFNRTEMLGDVFMPTPFEEFPPRVVYRLYKRAPQPHSNAPTIRRVCKYDWGDGTSRYLTIVLGDKIYGGNVFITTHPGSNGSEVASVERINNTNQYRDCTTRYATKEGTQFFQMMGGAPEITFAGGMKVRATCVGPRGDHLELEDVAYFRDGKFVLDEAKLEKPLPATIPFGLAGMFGMPNKPGF